MNIERIFLGSISGLELLASACAGPNSSPESYLQLSTSKQGVYISKPQIDEQTHNMPSALRGQTLEWLGDYCQGVLTATLTGTICEGLVVRFTGQAVAASSVVLCPKIPNYRIIHCIDSGVVHRPLRSGDLPEITQIK